MKRSGRDEEPVAAEQQIKQTRSVEQLAQHSPIPTSTCSAALVITDRSGGPTPVPINYNYQAMSTANKVAHMDRLNSMVGLGSMQSNSSTGDVEMKMP